MDKEYDRQKGVPELGAARDAVFGPGEGFLGDLTLPPGGAYLYRGEGYSLATADPASGFVFRLMDLAPDIPWSDRLELAEHVAEVLSTGNVRRLHLRARPGAGDVAALAGCLERRGVVLVERTDTPPSAEDDYLSEEDSDAVIKRLKDLGYM